MPITRCRLKYLISQAAFDGGGDAEDRVGGRGVGGAGDLGDGVGIGDIDDLAGLVGRGADYSSWR